MTRSRCPTLVLLMCLIVSETHSSEPLTYSINTKKWSHVLDDHFISITINPTDLLQGKAFGLAMNSTVAILKGLSPAYIRIGSADTGKYTFKRSRYPGDVARTEDEFIITESHWTIFNDVVRSADLDIIVCLNAAHRNGANKKWDTRNTLELISFSDSQGYNLTFQLGYEVHRSSGISGHQYGKDLNRLRTILNAFPRYQHSRLIGPDIKVLHKKEDAEFINEVLLEAGPVLDAITWHPRWPQPSKMKVSDVSELGYEFPSDYIEWDRSQLGKILQRSIFKNPIWIGEPRTESTGTFAEGLLWARRLVLAAKLGVEVVMKQPSLMDISHPKPEYWIAFLHKRLLGKAVLETRPMSNQTDLSVITHCTNSLFWSERPSKALDGAVTVYAVNMGGKEQKVFLKGSWGGKSHVMFQYLLTSGSDPDSVFSQMTYLNGEPLMMTDDGNLPDITPRIKRIERGVVFKLPPYSVGFWVVPEARVKICQSQPVAAANVNSEKLAAGSSAKNDEKHIVNIRNLNQLIVDKLKNPVSDSDEENYDDRLLGSDSDDTDLMRESMESPRPRTSRRVRETTMEDIGQELKEKIREIREMLENKEAAYEKSIYSSEALRAAEDKITSLTDELGTATRLTNQQEEFGRFLHQAGLNQDFGKLMVDGRTGFQGLRRSVHEKNQWTAIPKAPSTTFGALDSKIHRFRRSLSYPEDDYEEEGTESYSSEEEDNTEIRPNRKINYRKRLSRLYEDSDESGNHSGYSGSPLLKGLEDKYKSIVSYRVQDGRRKLNDLRRLKKKDETEESKKPVLRKSGTLGNDLQEEILMKEVEVLEKTEEAMTNLIKNHKKRAQSIEEIILHEISDIKEDRLAALEDVRLHKDIKNGMDGINLEGDIEETEISPKMRRSVIDVLHKNSDAKTKRSIAEVDANLNGLPDNSQNYKKLKISKRSLDYSYERPFRNRKAKRTNRDDENSNEKSRRHLRKSRSERLERMKNFIQSRERIRDRNIYRKKNNRSNRKHNAVASEEDSSEIMAYGPDLFDKSQDLVIKEIQKEILKAPERKQELKQPLTEGVVAPSDVKLERNEERRFDEDNTSSSNKNNSDNAENDGNKSNGDSKGAGIQRSESQKQRPKSEEKKGNSQESKATTKNVKAGEQPEYIPLKIDKNRGLNVLKRISNLVESINTKEKTKGRKMSADVEDLSEEFYGDALSKITKRRHRRSHLKDGEVVESSEPIDDVARHEFDTKDTKAWRKEIKLRKLLDRMNRKKKTSEDENGEQPTSRLRARLQAKLARLVAAEPAPVTEVVQDVEGADKSVVEESTTTTPPTHDTLHEENLDGTKEVTVKIPKTDDTTDVVPQNSGNSERVQGLTTTSATDLFETTSEPPKPTTTTTTSENPSQKRNDEGNVEESVITPETILVIPEIDGLVYNPIVVATPAEDDPTVQGSTDMDDSVQVIDGPEDDGQHLLIVNPFVRKLPEELPPIGAYAGSADGTRNKNVEQELPDLISELIEGERSPWKEEHYHNAEDVMEMDKNRRYIPNRLESAETNALLSRESEAQNDDVAAETERSFGGVVPDVKTSTGEFLENKATGEGSQNVPVAADGASENGNVDGILEKSTAHFTEETRKSDGALRRRRRGILDRRMLTPEERIRNFKRTVHRRHSPFFRRNDLPLPNEGDSFWKMAGSTVKAVFNDVIPEAYGKTKDKIEHLGIAEYFKEFGKIVEQMKNLDKLFANIGQAAVRNYIKGTEDEKGDYIQVIEKKRRARRDADEVSTAEETAEDPDAKVTTEMPEETTTVTPQTNDQTKKTTVTPPDAKVRTKSLKNNAKERPNDLIRDIFLMDSNPGIVEVTKSPPSTEPTQTISLQPFESRYSRHPKLNHMHGRLYRRDNIHRGTASALTEHEIQTTGMSKFAPWMRTTKDFINQALTTLQRQRELSEMIARESVNDMVKREIERKVVGKREAQEDRRLFPVYQMPTNRKREVYSNVEDSVSKYLTHLQPGVYIVPTEDMKNLRSEQIMKEAPTTKPGMPNMVTLNIYYDKKKPQDWEEASKEEEVTRMNDYLRYYPHPSVTWNPVPTANPPPDFVPPLQETTIESSYLPSIQGISSFQAEAKIHEPLTTRILQYPEQYTDWTSPGQRGHPLAPRAQQQTFFYPGQTHFGQQKSDWSEFKPHHAPVPEGSSFASSPDSGWAVQFQQPKKKPSRTRDPLRPVERPHRTFPDKKRSIGNSRTDPNFSGLALPFWKFFVPKKGAKEPREGGKTNLDAENSDESESIEELFAENRKRARMNEAKKKEENPEVTDKPEGAVTETKTRKRRDLALVEFHDHDLIPEWFGTVQELDNTLHEHHGELERLARIVPETWAEYGDDEMYVDPGILLHRRRRDVDGSADDSHPALKSINSEDSSLEVPSVKNPESKPEDEKSGSSDDALSQFFKYAYESLIQMMKGMTSFI